jgi:hypothetical protein
MQDLYQKQMNINANHVYKIVKIEREKYVY